MWGCSAPSPRMGSDWIIPRDGGGAASCSDPQGWGVAVHRSLVPGDGGLGCIIPGTPGVGGEAALHRPQGQRSLYCIIPWSPETQGCTALSLSPSDRGHCSASRPSPQSLGAALQHLPLPRAGGCAVYRSLCLGTAGGPSWHWALLDAGSCSPADIKAGSCLSWLLEALIRVCK